ncbi:MAG: hypothetical protein D3907_02680 [Candidatus Electrothrix sp. AUS3]|nr:hypothetical protein [Candidatus Electrothrix gigas]
MLILLKLFSLIIVGLGLGAVPLDIHTKIQQRLFQVLVQYRFKFLLRSQWDIMHEAITDREPEAE